jgi:hypothetical protein
MSTTANDVNQVRAALPDLPEAGSDAEKKARLFVLELLRKVPDSAVGELAAYLTQDPDDSLSTIPERELASNDLFLLQAMAALAYLARILPPITIVREEDSRTYWWPIVLTFSGGHADSLARHFSRTDGLARPEQRRLLTSPYVLVRYVGLVAFLAYRRADLEQKNLPAVSREPLPMTEKRAGRISAIRELLASLGSDGLPALDDLSGLNARAQQTLALDDLSRASTNALGEAMFQLTRAISTFRSST